MNTNQSNTSTSVLKRFSLLINGVLLFLLSAIMYFSFADNVIYAGAWMVSDNAEIVANADRAASVLFACIWISIAIIAVGIVVWLLERRGTIKLSAYRNQCFFYITGIALIAIVLFTYPPIIKYLSI